ncbi:MBL fold metallo-hydrolase [Pseudodesulfovibrio sp. JC047]|uniref:MBL fold metallo-hydrolase n=1 Tax=Pseudodesulfovibrio sp. JC047 TaxID=2683199 RepID=UPI0013D57841|nr:ribonuclease Z [Pseudodesulfovibrio sp. JC047]NDV20091.1 MBL fold metallo-hydrolase [Pseudodesulfovibrio sp. JC047]
MRVTFAGVGEAFDETVPNTSLLVHSGGSSVLLDCGFTAACAFWGMADNPLALDAVYISHFHGDHYFGLPALLVRSIEEGRTKRLTILGPSGIESRVTRLMEMAYSNAMARAQFGIFFVECDPGQDFRHAGFRFRFAMTNHAMPCQAIRLDDQKTSLFYSGDGQSTADTLALASGSDLVVHESYTLEPEHVGHGSVTASVDFARKAGAKACALVHLQRTVRRERKAVIRARANGVTDMKVLLPEPGDIHIL